MEPLILEHPLGDNPPKAYLYYGENVLDVLKRLPADSIHTVVTSPPYFGLRSYNTDPVIWDAQPGCIHDWGDEIPQTSRHLYTEDNCTKEKTVAAAGGYLKAHGCVCQNCGAWRGELGSEPTPEMFVQHLVEIFREVRRVLHPSGTLWLNLGDSYSGSGGAGGDYSAGGLREGQPKYSGRNVANLKTKDLCGIPWRTALALQADGWWLRSDIIWAKGISFCPEYSGTCMPECLDCSTQVFVRQNGWVSRTTLGILASREESPPEILGPDGWVQIKKIWRTVRPAMKLEAGKVEDIICSPEHKFPISSDRRRLRIREEAASEIRHEGYADYLLYCPIGKHLTPTLSSWSGVPLNFELGFMLGAYTAEGGFKDPAGWSLKLTIGLHELEFAAKIRAYSNSLGLSFKETEESNCRYFFLTTEWFSRMAECFTPNKCKQKYLNIELLLNCPESFRKGLLDGYVEGDGSDRLGGGWSASSASRRLRDDMSTLASSVGVITSKGHLKGKDKRTGNDFEGWNLWTPYQTRRKSKFGKEGIFQIPPRSRRLLNEEREMVDLEVEGGLFLIGDGLVTHNSVTDRPTKSHEYMFLLTKSQHYFWDINAIREPHQLDSLARSLRGRSDSHKWTDGPGGQTINSDEGMENICHPGGRNVRSVWTVPESLVCLRDDLDSETRQRVLKQLIERGLL